ncbi:MAG: glycosyltransferase [Chryseobacterium sp.]|nr:MAG: glycosyltransferase [Chryseobacterium sp.]
MLEGYDCEFLINTAKNPGSHHFNGINNPDLNIKIESFSPNAILIYGWAYQSHLYAMRFFKGKIPLWFRGDSTLLDEKNSFKNTARSLFLKWIYQHINMAFYVGTSNKAYFEKFGLKPDQLKFAPHAIDNDRFGIDRFDEAQTLRNKLGIVDSEILVLFAGKLEQKKNPDLLLEAFLELNTNDVHLLFVGNGELEESLRLKVKNLKQKAESLKLNIHFMNFQNQNYMPVVYQACDLFCLPSQGPNETWGLAINEAMATGKAILISNKVGCAEDLVLSGINGEIFLSGSLSDLSFKLNKLLSVPDQLILMGKESKRIIQNWTIQKQVKSIVNTLNEEY